MKKIIILLIVLLIGFSGCNESINDGIIGVELTPNPTPAPEQTVSPNPTIEPTETPTSNEPEPLKIEISSIELDKNVFSSKEDLNVRVLVESSSEVNGLELHFLGINAKGWNRIRISREIDLNKGLNEFEFFEQTPNCTSGCSGVWPGVYDLNFWIWAGETELAFYREQIELVGG